MNSKYKLVEYHADRETLIELVKGLNGLEGKWECKLSSKGLVLSRKSLLMSGRKTAYQKGKDAVSRLKGRGYI